MRIRFALAVAVIALASAPAHAGGTAGTSPQQGDQKTQEGDQKTTRWPTDEPARTGMVAIRDLVRGNHSLITHRRMPPDYAVRFAKEIKAQADGILALSKMEGEAKERLGALLAEVTAGVEAVANPEKGVTAIDGLARVDEALARYPAEFDHPDWAPVQSLE
jgi:hypothetical protein